MDETKREKIIHDALLTIHRNEMAVTKIQEAVHMFQISNNTLRHVLLTLNNNPSY